METSVVPCQHQKKKRSAPRPSGDLFPFLKRPIPSLGTEQGDGGQKAPEYLQDELRRSVFAILANLPPFDPLPSFATFDQALGGLFDLIRNGADKNSLLNCDSIINLQSFALGEPNMCQYMKKRLSQLFWTLPPALFYLLHHCGAFHYQDSLGEQFPSAPSDGVMLQQCQTPFNFWWPSFITSCLSISTQSPSCCASYIIQHLLRHIGTLAPDTPSLLTGLLNLELSERVQDSILESLCSSAPTNAADAFPDWQPTEAPSNGVLQKLAENLRGAFLPEALSTKLLSKLFLLDTINTCFFLQCLAPMPNMVPLLFRSLNSSIRGRSTAATRLLLLTFHLSESEYYKTLEDTWKQATEDEKSTFSAILIFSLVQAPNHIITDHIKFIRTISKSTLGSCKTFCDAANDILELRSAPAPSALSAPSLEDPHTSRVKQWIAHFGAQGKAPTKEISSLKMFKPTDLASTIDLLLSTTLTMESNMPGVKLVEAMQRENCLGAAKSYAEWMEARKAAARVSARVSPINTHNHSSRARLDTLQAHVSTWYKSLSAGGNMTQVILTLDALMAQIQVDHLVELKEVFKVLWTGLEAATKSAEYLKKVLECDKFLSSTLFGYQFCFWPILSERISSITTCDAQDLNMLVLTSAILASHDNVSFAARALRSPWTPMGAFAWLSSHQSLQAAITYLIRYYSLLLTRFKTIAIGNETLSATSSDMDAPLEAASKRIGMIDHKMACFTNWIVAKLDRNGSANARSEIQLKLLLTELKGLLQKPLLKPLIATPRYYRMSELLRMEGAYEALDASESDFSQISQVLLNHHLRQEFNKSIPDFCAGLFSEMRAICKESDKVVLKKVVLAAIKSSSKNYFSSAPSSPMPSQTPPLLASTGVSKILGAENKNPNAVKKSEKFSAPSESRRRDWVAELIENASRAQEDDNGQGSVERRQEVQALVQDLANFGLDPRFWLCSSQREALSQYYAVLNSNYLKSTSSQLILMDYLLQALYLLLQKGFSHHSAVLFLLDDAPRILSLIQAHSDRYVSILAKLCALPNIQFDKVVSKLETLKSTLCALSSRNLLNSAIFTFLKDNVSLASDTIASAIACGTQGAELIFENLRTLSKDFPQESHFFDRLTYKIIKCAYDDMQDNTHHLAAWHGVVSFPGSLLILFEASNFRGSSGAYLDFQLSLVRALSASIDMVVACYERWSEGERKIFLSTVVQIVETLAWAEWKLSPSVLEQFHPAEQGRQLLTELLRRLEPFESKKSLSPVRHSLLVM